MKVLCVTHSERSFVEARSALNTLETRFPPERLTTLPPLESLAGIDSAVPFSGALSLWGIDEQNGFQLTFLTSYNPDYKVQSAVFHQEFLLVYGADRLEILDTRLRAVKTITDPWIAGGHTVYPDADGCVWVTSAPANAALKVDLQSGKIVKRLLMPQQYGRGYQLKTTDDVRQHWIPTDFQPTHINSAYPVKDGILVTLWIPGAVGLFDAEHLSYREIVSGFRGCHGGRCERETGALYVTDSPAGIVWFFDFETGEIQGRLKIESVWLHDVDQIRGDIFAAGLSDKNEIQIVDKTTGEVLQRVGCDRFGQSVMFVNACEVDQAWGQAFRSHLSTVESQAEGPIAKKPLGRESLPPFLELSEWEQAKDVAVAIGPILKSGQPLQYEYLLSSDPFELNPGEYILEGEIYCHRGGLALGLLNLISNTWLVQLTFDSVLTCRQESLRQDECAVVQVIIAAFNPTRRMMTAAEIRHISLRSVVDELDEHEESEVAEKGNLAAERSLIRTTEGVRWWRREVQQRDEQIQKLHTDLEEQTERWKCLQAEVNRRDGLLEELQAAVGAEESRVAQLQAEVNRRDGLLEELQAAVAAEGRRFAQQLQAEVTWRDEMLVEAEEKMEELQAEVNLRDELLADLQDKFQARESVFLQLQEEHERQKTVLAQFTRVWRETKGIKALQAEVNKRDVLLNDLQAKFTEREASAVQLQAEVSRRDALLQQLQVDINKRQKITHKLQAEVNRRDMLLLRLQTELNTQGEATSQLQHEVNRRDELLKLLQEKVNVQEERIAQLQAQIHGQGALRH